MERAGKVSACVGVHEGDESFFKNSPVNGRTGMALGCVAQSTESIFRCLIRDELI